MLRSREGETVTARVKRQLEKREEESERHIVVGTTQCQSLKHEKDTRTLNERAVLAPFYAPAANLI